MIIIEEKNLHLVEEALGAFNANDLDGLVEFYTESALHYQPTRSEPLRDRSAIREDYMESTFLPFPDAQFEKIRAFSQGSWVCVEGILTGTHKGPFGTPSGETVSATNKHFRVAICLVFKIKDGKIIEAHEYND